MEELTRKIAEFAGFVEKGSGYVWPDGRFDKAPDFTDPEWGIAYLFKWVMPHLFSYEIENAKGGDEGHEAFVNYGEPLGFEGYHALAGTPALALCYAVEKLIDAEVLVSHE